MSGKTAAKRAPAQSNARLTEMEQSIKSTNEKVDSLVETVGQLASVIIDASKAKDNPVISNNYLESQEQDLGAGGQRPQDRQPLRLAARKAARGLPGLAGQPAFGQQFGDALAPFRPSKPLTAQHEIQVRRHRPAQQDRPLEHHGLTRPVRGTHGHAALADRTPVGRDQSVQAAQQQAFPGTVGAKDQGRPRPVQHKFAHVQQGLAIDGDMQPGHFDRGPLRGLGECRFTHVSAPRGRH